MYNPMMTPQLHEEYDKSTIEHDPKVYNEKPKRDYQNTISNWEVMFRCLEDYKTDVALYGRSLIYYEIGFVFGVI